MKYFRNSFVMLAGLSCAVSLGAEAQKSSKQKKQPPTPETNSSTSGAPGTTGTWSDPLINDPELANLNAETIAYESEYLKQGNWSIDLSAIQGTSLWKQGAAGFRYFISSSQALSFDFLFGLDKQKEQTSYGLSLASLSYFSHKGRAQPFLWIQVSGGIDKAKKKDASKDNSDDKFKGGTSFGAGVEVFLLKELSLSARAGLSAQIVPTESLQVVTGTGELGIHFLVGAE